MDFAKARAELVRRLASDIKDERVLKAMAKVPRELFVPPEVRHLAYEDAPLPIGFGQTISQPYIVALMSEALELKGNEKVLEVGTGSGYQAAILAELAREVISIERIPELAERARQILEDLGYKNVRIYLDDGVMGYPQEAPFDGIIVTAGAPSVPHSLLSQLGVGGRLVIPVGSRLEQELLKITRTNGNPKVETLGGCRFVPLIHKEAWPKEDGWKF